MLRMLGRRGVGLLEVVIALTLIALAGAALLPTLASTISRARVERVALRINQFPAEFNAFRAQMKQAPGRISHVAQPITTSDVRGCAATPTAYSTKEVAQWTDSKSASYGPWIRDLTPRRDVFGVSFVLGEALGRVVDTLYRDPPNTGATMLFLVREVDQQDAEELDLIIDGAADPAAGNLRWGTPAADGQVNSGLSANGRVSVQVRMAVACT